MTPAPTTGVVSVTTSSVTVTPAASTSSSTGSGNCSQKKVVCYYPNWAHYRAGKTIEVLYFFLLKNNNFFIFSKFYRSWQLQS